jgi:hypothetical protein
VCVSQGGDDFRALHEFKLQKNFRSKILSFKTPN